MRSKNLINKELKKEERGEWISTILVGAYNILNSGKEVEVNESELDVLILKAIDKARADAKDECAKAVKSGVSAQGYCTKRNEKKVLDGDLLRDVEDAIVREIKALK